MELDKNWIFMILDSGCLVPADEKPHYASYQAMWAALGDPESQKIWKHLGIIKHFVRGYWYEPTHPKNSSGLLEEFRLPLRDYILIG